MMIRKRRIGLLLAMLMFFSLSLSACDLLKKTDSDVPADLPVMEQSPENVQLQKDAKGMTESERQHLAYGKEHWSKFLTAVNDFKPSMDKYVDDIFNKAISVEENNDYIQSRDKILKAAKRLEAVNPKGIPASFKNAYDQMTLAANRARGLIAQIKQQNGVNLPGAYDKLLSEIGGVSEKLQEFYNKVESDGLEAASGIVPAVDWAAESAREIENYPVFNVYDLGIAWGASRYDVMGVEGLKENAMDLEWLEYDTYVYQYGGKRKYHFNEYGQMDQYVYELNGADHDRGIYNTDPVLDDLQELSPILEFHFVPDTIAEPQTPLLAADGSGDYVVEFDQPAESIVMRANPATPEAPILVTVTAKTVQ